MKKKIIYFFWLIPSLAFGYTWNSFGPEGITTYDICFNVGSEGYAVISTSAGICICDGTGSTWNMYTNFGLSALQAIPFDSTDILIIMENGTSLDGIYKFNFVTHLFFHVKNVTSPTFIKYCPTNQTYYAGSLHDGLLSSTDGIVWNTVPFFNSQPTTSMDFFNNHLVVSEGSQFYTIYYSSDTGKTWNPGSGSYITYIAFHPGGILYGFIPISVSGSLQESTDFGQTWNILYWTYGLNAIGYDALGNVMVGWKNSSVLMDHGIAKYNASLHSMTFFNEGLPNFIINNIRNNSLLSSITIFCCTDSGVYISNDYWTGIDDKLNFYEKVQISNFPNPCATSTKIEFYLPNYQGNSVELSIYDISGSKLKTQTYILNKTDQSVINLNVSGFHAGIYLYRLQAGKYDVMKKLIVER